jgi:hypothetical protein
MANDAITIGGNPVASKDRGGVQYQRFLDANAVSATVIKASITQSSAVAAIAADTTTRRQMTIVNTGGATVEISPTQSFALGNGFPLVAGSGFTTNYSGAIYALTASGTGELRAWSED